MHSGKANEKGRCRNLRVFVICVFTMGCILPCLLLPDGGTETAVPLLLWKSRKMSDIKRIDLFVHGLFLRVLHVSFPSQTLMFAKCKCICEIYCKTDMNPNQKNAKYNHI